MSQGYFQVRLLDRPEGSHITTFLCKCGIFRWRVMPMGIQPASDSLSHQIQAIFGNLFRTYSVVEGASMVRDLDDFFRWADTLSELESLLTV